MADNNSISLIYMNAVNEYLSLLDLTDLPAPYEMECDLLALINGVIKTCNVDREKSDRFAYLKTLPARLIADLILHIYPVKKIIWNHDSTVGELFIYQTDGDDKGIYSNDAAVFHQIIRQFDYASRPSTVDDVMQILSDCAVVAKVNNDPDLVPVNNGIFNYKTKELMPFSPDYIFTTKSRVDYNPNAKNVVIHNDADNTDWDVESWMHELSDDDAVVDLLWQVIGASVRPYVRWDKIVCFYSTIGCNGKGTLCRLIRNLCRNTANIPFSSFGDEFILEQLLNASAIITDENVTRSYIRCTDKIKAVVTHDNITINRKYRMPITIKFDGLMIQCINDMPKFGDKTDSLYRRLLLIPFEKTFVNCDREYIKEEYLNKKEVLEYVLFKILNTDYYKFSNPEVCKTFLEDFKVFNDPVRDFLNEILPQCKWSLLPYDFLYDLYKEWLKDNCPTGQLQGKRTFIQDVKTVMISSQEWLIKNTPVQTRSHMNETETLIYQYDLTRWKSDYKGNDISRICNFTKKASYRGLLKNT